MKDLEDIVAIELENFSPEEAIDKTVLAKHIETFQIGRASCRERVCLYV